jgi:hypothetical protein
VTSPFVPRQPVRIRFEAVGTSFDEIVPACVIARPSADGASVQVTSHQGSREELVTLYAGLIGQAHNLGVLGDALSAVLSGKLRGETTVQLDPPAGTRPLDDVPPHLRRPPGA